MTIVTLTNDSDTPRVLQLTTYGEVVLAPLAADHRHPAFTKLFVESAPLPTGNGVMFRRRPRAAHEQPYCLVHMLVVPPQDAVSGVTWESDRARFLGRNRTARNPLALETALSNTTGATLDPVMALRTTVTLPPRAGVTVAVITLVADSRTAALRQVQRYQAWATIERAFPHARSSTEQELHQLGIDSEALASIQRVLSGLLYPHPALRAEAATLAANVKGQEGLWAYGISGDYPILLVCVDDESAGDLLQSVLQAHTYWRRRGVQVDLVLLNQQETSYGQAMQGFLFRLLRRMDGEEWLNQRGGIFVLRNDQLPEADRTLLLSAARVVLHGDRGALAAQLGTLLQPPTPLPAFVPSHEATAGADAPPLARPQDLLFDNGYGGFSADGREYVVYRTPPAPWCNVIANPHAGFIVSDSGGGYTWAGNSGENRLTTWRNDPVSDQPSEVIYLRDEETAALWSATPQPAGADQPYLVRHGAGYTIFQHHSHHLRHALRLFMAPDTPVKLMHLRLENLAPRPRRITVTLYAEWVLGVERSATQQYLVSAYDEGARALLARNAYSAEFGAAVAFVAASKPPHGLTADRGEFFGRLGTLQRPAALERIGLAGSVGAGHDPCAAFQVHLDLPAGGSEEVTFLLGQGADRATALALVQRFQDPGQVRQAMRSVLERLVNRNERLILLFTPPFDQTRHDPGYVKGYLPGIRENGGQYTHAALWTIWAFACLGEGDLAADLFRLINPIWRSETAALVDRYQVEPYVISADVYGVAPHTGRGGWTWYTGSAGWMYRLGLEALLGLRRQGDRLRFAPCLPRDWTQVSLTYRYGTTTYHIRIENPQGVQGGVEKVTVDSTELADGVVPLRDDGGHHQVVIHLGQS